MSDRMVHISGGLVPGSMQIVDSEGNLIQGVTRFVITADAASGTTRVLLTRIDAPIEGSQIMWHGPEPIPTVDEEAFLGRICLSDDGMPVPGKMMDNPSGISEK